MPPLAGGDSRELAAWLRLLGTPGVGIETSHRLLKAFGSPEAVFDASAEAIAGVIGRGAIWQALQKAPDGAAALLDETLRWRDADALGRRRWIPLGDPLYPEALLQTADPPLLLFSHGRADLLARPSVAVVGSRNATPQGRENARAFSEHLSRKSLTIVSGLALGIDAAAHEGGLNGNGRTIAVVGTGLDRVYPRRHLDLAHRIATDGLIVSEFPLGTPPLPANFPRRNRIIAGLSLGTLVVEAAPQSGSLITARLGAEAGREVFAIPGSIHSPQSRGCHRLIKQGAKLVETADDILEELSFKLPGHADEAGGAASADARAASDPLLDALGFDAVGLDTLLARTGWPAPRISAKLLELELDGHVSRLPGGLYQRIGRA